MNSTKFLIRVIQVQVLRKQEGLHNTIIQPTPRVLFSRTMLLEVFLCSNPNWWMRPSFSFWKFKLLPLWVYVIRAQEGNGVLYELYIA